MDDLIYDFKGDSSRKTFDDFKNEIKLEKIKPGYIKLVKAKKYVFKSSQKLKASQSQKLAKSQNQAKSQKLVKAKNMCLNQV